MATEPLAQQSRRCPRCSQTKPANRENFGFIRCKNKWHPWCKPCCAAQRREDRARRPEHYAKIGKASRDRNLDETRARSRAKYWATRDERFEQERARLNANRERYAEARKLRRVTDPEWARRQRESARKRREENPERYREYARLAWSKATPQRRLRNFFTAAICHSLKGSTKGGRSWEAILGYSAEDLRAHLERQFLPGMNWGNYGEWHVDHILPVVSFTFETADVPEFRACWALSNLRPMWAADNIRKSDKRIYLI